ncbi:MAG: ATP synthase subunit I [Xanthomonadales bacterium]|nr:ATP synthase subunit I [Xanthomonadales bacterium]
MKTALPLVLAQFIATLVAAALGLFASAVTAYSLLAGGLVCVLPNTWFASSLYLQSRQSSGDPEQDAGRFVSAAYKGEAIKLLLTGALFALVFSQLRPMNAMAVFAGYIICLLVNLVGLKFIGRDPIDRVTATITENNEKADKSIDNR